MTCIVITLAHGRAHIFADSACLDARGTLAFSASKIRAFPERRFAIAARGSAVHGLLLGLLARRCRSYDDARARLSRALRGPLGRILCLSVHFELYVAGIDASGAPAAFMLVSHRRHEVVEPCTAYDVETITTGSLPPDIDPKADPVAFGVRAAQLQRGVLQRLPFSRRAVSIVGGRLEHIEISPTGVRREVLGGWSDRLGEILNPKAAFSRAGATVRKAPLMSLNSWLFPRTPSAALRFMAMIFAAYAVAVLVLNTPAAARIEWTYHGAPQTTVETAVGSWDAYVRLDLGKLITSPTLGRETANAAVGRKSRLADHAEAARLVLAEAKRDCEIVASREVLLDEFEHDVACRP